MGQCDSEKLSAKNPTDTLHCGLSENTPSMQDKEDESLVDLFRLVANNPQTRKQVVLCAPPSSSDEMQASTEEWTLGQLDELTERLALLFVGDRFKCRKGDCIAIYMNKRAEYAFSYIAALKAGCAYLPLDISYTKELLVSVIDEVRPLVICTTEEHARNLPAGLPLFVFDAGGAWREELDSVEKLSCGSGREVGLPADVTADDVAYIVYSSGTTGKPKGIACPHRGAVISYKHRFETEPYKDGDAIASNVFFVWEFFRPILQGTKMVIIPDDIIYDPSMLCLFLRKHRITSMLFTPSLLETILDTQSDEILQQSFAHFRLIHLCGEVVTTALVRRLMAVLPHIHYTNLYSISETHDVAVADLNAFHTRTEQRQFAPAGQLINRVKILVLNADLKAVPMGVSGEIYVAGPTLAIGYINRPELNKNRFLEVPREYLSEMGRRMYKTGDWGYLLPNSTLEICGRCETMMVGHMGGEIKAIESSLLKLCYVLSCAVLAVGKEGEDKQLVAYLTLSKPVSRKNIRADLKKHLPFYMVPRFFLFLDKMPVLAASSKLDRKALPSVDYDRDAVEADALPQTPTEKKLARIWCSLLKQSRIDIHESFFDLGGQVQQTMEVNMGDMETFRHSLLAARLLRRIKQEFRVELTISDFFTFSTVYSMARLLNGCKLGEKMVNLDDEVNKHDVPLHNVADIHYRAFWRALEWERRFYRCNILLTARVFCLVRQTDQDSTVDERVDEALRVRGLLSKELKVELKGRVKVISGDTALSRFGLAEEQFHLLSYDIDVVIHSAANVNLIYPYHALRSANVLGTINMLEFCLLNKVKALHYVSSDAVIPSRLSCVDEDFPVELVKEKLADGYGQSKYVAEQLVKRFSARGLPSIVYRLGNQAASTHGGHWNDNDLTYLILLSVFATGKAPILEWEVELTPVDFTARLIAELATGGGFVGSFGKTYHLINTSTPKWATLVEWIIQMGFPAELMSFEKWRNVILTSGDTQLKKVRKLLEGVLLDESYFTTLSSYKRSNTDRLLRDELRLDYPTVDRLLFTYWVRLLCQRHIITPPRQLIGMPPLGGKVVLVTGASEGIGEAISRALAIDGGATVMMAARQEDKLEKIASEIKASMGHSAVDIEGGGPALVETVCCDITQSNQVDSMISEAIGKFGKIDALVNCAGCMYFCIANKGFTEEWKRQIDVNVTGTTLVTGAVVPHMVRRKSGHIVNITSDAGKKGFAGLAVYSGTKFYIEGFMQALRHELIDHGVLVTNVQPGDVSTRLADRSTDAEAKMLYDHSKAGHKILSAEDIARSVLFALSQPPHVSINELLIEPAYQK